MKKLLLALLCFMTFFQGCSTGDDLSIADENVSAINLPAASEAYGKAVAKELRAIVLNLNEQGINYSIMEDSPSFKTKFYQDISKASPSILRTKSTASQIMVSPELAERYSNLSSIQIDYVTKITNEVNKSKSFKDLQQIVSNLNDDIYKNVPKIEQERLFNVTAVLYYGAKEILRLEEGGQMLSLSKSNYKLPRLKSGLEGTFGEACRKFLATGWIIAVGEPTPAGEIVMSIATVVVAGVLLYEVITCRRPGTGGNPNQGYCQLRYAGCTSSIPNGCGICLQYCLVQGSWPPYSSHKCT